MGDLGDCPQFEVGCGAMWRPGWERAGKKEAGGEEGGKALRRRFVNTGLARNARATRGTFRGGAAGWGGIVKLVQFARFVQFGAFRGTGAV